MSLFYFLEQREIIIVTYCIATSGSLNWTCPPTFVIYFSFTTEIYSVDEVACSKITTATHSYFFHEPMWNKEKNLRHLTLHLLVLNHDLRALSSYLPAFFSNFEISRLSERYFHIRFRRKAGTRNERYTFVAQYAIRVWSLEDIKL